MTATAPAAPRTTTPTRFADVVIDAGERLLVLALYVWLVFRMVDSYRRGGEPASLLLLPSEGLIVVFLLLRRRAGEISRNPVEWALAMAASSGSLLVAPSSVGSLVPPIVGLTVILMGMLIQVHAKLVLGRSFGCIPAHRGLKLSGPYRLVRHPMYAGYLLSHLGFLALNPSARNIAIYAACYALQVPRLLAEERLLSGDPEYRAYRETVRYRIVPGLF